MSPIYLNVLHQTDPQPFMDSVWRITASGGFTRNSINYRQCVDMDAPWWPKSNLTFSLLAPVKTA